MAGIGVEYPIGPGWEHSMNEQNWQTSNIFLVDGAGQAFVDGQKYTVFSRNVGEEIFVKDTIIYTADTNEDTLDDVAKRGGVKKGWTDQLLRLMGGLFLGNIPYTTQPYPELLLGPDGRVYQKGSQPVMNLVIIDHFEETADIVVPSLNLVITEHFEETADVIVPVEPFTARASVEINDCEQFAGWVYVKGKIGEVDIKVDGVVIATETAKIVRTDVQQYLSQQGITTTITVFQFNHIKAVTWRDGQPHVWQAFIAGTNIEAAEYHAPKSKTCAAPVDNTPYVTQIKQVEIVSVNKGVSKTIKLIEVLSNGQIRDYTGSAVPTWSIEGDPTGIVLSPYNPGKTVDVVALNTATVSSFVVKCSLALPQTVQVITVGCERPANLTTYQASWHFVPQGGFSDPAYPTLDAANNTIGQHFDGTRTGNLDLFPIQVEKLEVGQPVFLGLKKDCEKAGDNIYGLTSSSGGNTVKKAIQVANGVIIAIKDSLYQTPTTPTNHAPVLTAALGTLGAVGGTTQTLPLNPAGHFSDPDGDALTYRVMFLNPETGSYEEVPAWAFYQNGGLQVTAPVSTLDKNYVFRIIATDPAGLSTLDDFTVFVPGQQPEVPPTEVKIDSVAIWVKEPNAANGTLSNVVFLYRATLPPGTQLEDQWLEYFSEFGFTPEFTPSSEVVFLPAGYEDYHYYMPYTGTNAMNSVGGTHHLKVRKVGSTDLLLDITFNASGLTMGKIRTIYTAP